MREQTLWIPGRMPGLNDYIGAMNHNRFLGNQMKQENTNLVAMLAKTKLNPVKYPVTIQFVWQEPNDRRDPDNIIFAKKFILDGLVVAGILPNDTQKWIMGFSDSWISAPPKNSKVSVHPQIEPGIMVTVKEIV